MLYLVRNNTAALGIPQRGANRVFSADHIRGMQLAIERLGGLMSGNPEDTLHELAD